MIPCIALKDRMREINFVQMKYMIGIEIPKPILGLCTLVIYKSL